MTLATIAPGRQLRTDSAASYTRMRHAGLPAGGITSAFRDPEEQRDLFLSRYRRQAFGSGPFNDVRWYAGHRYVRVSPLGMVGVPGTSKHELGLALDIDTGSAAHRWMLSHGAHNGWKRTIPTEPWHWEYARTRDQALKDAIARAKTRAAAVTKVKRVQKVLGTVRDGDPGPKTEWAFDHATSAQLRRIQRWILHVPVTGRHDAKTEAAWAALKTRAK